MDADHFKHLQILAFNEVISGSSAYYERYLLRWFSKTFSTPYPQVCAMPFDDVVQAFWEEHYGAMDEEDRKEAKFELLETPEERIARISKQEAEDAVLARIMNEASENNKKLSDVVKKDSKPIIPIKPAKEAELPKELKDLIKPDIEIKFASSEEDFENMINKIDSLGHKPQQS